MAGATPTPVPTTQVAAPPQTNQSQAPINFGAINVSPPSQSVPSIASTPPVISSKDNAGEFASNTNALASKVPTTTPTSTQQTFTTPNGAVVDAQGNIITPAPGSDTTGATSTAKTPIDSSANGGAGTTGLPTVTTGDPVYDSLQTWEQQQEQQNESDAAAQKAQIAQMLTTNLAANDATYAAQIAGITNTYAGLITTQTRINNLNNARVKAYGLASGNAMSTPIEFTYAVSNEEQTGLTAIQTLDDQRDSLIATAQAAQQSGDAKLLSDSMASVEQVETDMRNQTAALATLVTDRFTVLQKIEADQQTQLQQTQQNLLAAAVVKYGDQFNSATDSTTKDSIVKQIIQASGGVLDYGTVLGGLQTNATNAATTAETAAKDASTIALQGAQTTEAYASAANDAANASKTSAAQQQDEVNSALDNYIASPAAKTGGVPVLDQNGYFTKAGFTSAAAMAGENGMTRANFLQQYGSYLDPGGYSNYGLTKQEQDVLNDVNKTTPIYIPTSSTSSGG